MASGLWIRQITAAKVSSVIIELFPDHPEDCTQEMYIYLLLKKSVYSEVTDRFSQLTESAQMLLEAHNHPLILHYIIRVRLDVPAQY